MLACEYLQLGREEGKKAAKNGYTGSRWGWKRRKKAAGFWLRSVSISAVGKWGNMGEKGLDLGMKASVEKKCRQGFISFFKWPKIVAGGKNVKKKRKNMKVKKQF